MTIEAHFNVPFVAALALREKQIQQNYRPIIAVHKWFARRPGTLFRGLALAEFGTEPVESAFYKANSFPGKIVADPFMGGGIPLLEANRVGCDVIGFDINPMSIWIVREEIEHLDLPAYQKAAWALRDHLAGEVGDLYRTECRTCAKEVPIKYFLWVKLCECSNCGHAFDLFQGYLLAENKRHPRNVLVCAGCGDLNEVVDLKYPGACNGCGAVLRLKGPARRNRCACPKCGELNSYPIAANGSPKHRLFALEYHCSHCKSAHNGRFFKTPDSGDRKKLASAAAKWQATTPRYVPTERIPAGDETDRLHRWGYQSYSQLFNPRQLLGLEISARYVAALGNDRVRNALATNLSDLLRYQNMLCRYDTMALKSLDIFSVHGFPVSHVQCESNMLGITNGNGVSVGSGGWSNIIDKYVKAKRYCDQPFEIAVRNGRKTVIPINGEWIGEICKSGADKLSRRVTIRCRNSTEVEVPEQSLDAVFTDPPYFGNVQYGELMDFCYTWLRRLVGTESEGFVRASTRHSGELTGNITLERDLPHFAEGLAAVFQRMARALKPGAPLVFTYHHNRQEAYSAAAAAILDAKLTSSASLPCPAEMGGSIHIHGTGSSIVDTVFVCRSSGLTKRRWLFDSAEGLAAILDDEIGKLRIAGLAPSVGDIRCMVYGHLCRMAVWKLRKEWRSGRPMAVKLNEVSATMESIARLPDVLDVLKCTQHIDRRRISLAEEPREYEDDAVAF